MKLVNLASEIYIYIYFSRNDKQIIHIMYIYNVYMYVFYHIEEVIFEEHEEMLELKELLRSSKSFLNATRVDNEFAYRFYEVHSSN